MIAIKHRYTGVTMCEFDVETVKEAVELAIKNGSNLRGSNLSYSNLSGSNLRGSDLRGSDLSYSNLRGSDLSYSDLSYSDLSYSNLSYSNLSGSNLCGSNLSGSDLSYSNLSGSNLRGSNLSGSDLDGEKISKTPLSVGGLHYWCVISDGFMRLSCKRFTHNEWENFTDDEISDMDAGALKFWKQWKAPLLAMCAAHKPTGE